MNSGEVVLEVVLPPVNAMTADSVLYGFLNQTSANTTASQPELAATWDFLPAITLTLSIIGIFSNFSVLLMILLHNRLRTPFTVYLINLLANNLLYFLLESPLRIIDGLYSQWWLGYGPCGFYRYISYVCETVHMNNHALITINRIWAITFPISYKTYHSKRLAVLLCFGLWFYAHVMTTPMVVRNALYFIRPIELCGCSINVPPQYAYRLVIHLLGYDAPWLFVLGAYPFLWYKNQQRKKIKQLEIVRLHAMQNKHQRGNGPTKTAAVIAFKPGLVKERSYAFTVLTFLTANALFCWTLVQVYYGLRTFMDYKGTKYFYLAYFLFGLSPVLDPLYFTLSLRDLRAAFRTVFKKDIDPLPHVNTVSIITSDHSV